jgi:hypothetical protein
VHRRVGSAPGASRASRAVLLALSLAGKTVHVLATCAGDVRTFLAKMASPRAKVRGKGVKVATTSRVVGRGALARPVHRGWLCRKVSTVDMIRKAIVDRMPTSWEKHTVDPF